MFDTYTLQDFDTVDSRHNMVKQHTLGNMPFNGSQPVFTITGFHKLQASTKCIFQCSFGTTCDHPYHHR